MSTRRAAALGVSVGAVTFVVYMVGAGRALGYDSSVTVDAFIATPSVLDALTRQAAFNNHPILSFLTHVVFSLGGDSEAALRVVPAVFAAATVGVLSAWCARRWNVWAGIAAGLVLAANPMFAELSREVRGYSVLVFSAVSSTILFGQLLEGRNRWRVAGYIAAIALGLATHLFAGIVVLAHFGVVAYRRVLSREWLTRWAIAIAAGCAVYLGMARAMGSYMLNSRGRWFQPSFPVDMAREALGHYAGAVIPLALLVGIALWLYRRSDLVPVGLGLLALVAFIWLGPAPADLAPRFLAAVVPVVAVAVAAVVARYPAALALVGVAAAVLIAEQWSTWKDSELPNREAAAYAVSVQRAGGEVCGARYSGEPLWAYAQRPVAVLEARDFAHCELAVGIPSHPVERDLLAAAHRMFPHEWRLDGRDDDIVVFSRKSREELQPLPAVRISASAKG